MIPSPSSLADRSSHLDDFLNQHFEQTPLDNFKQSFFDQLFWYLLNFRNVCDCCLKIHPRFACFARDELFIMLIKHLPKDL